jgi:hypothetical protein
LKVKDLALFYFWGLVADAASSWGCPVGLYQQDTGTTPSSALTIWNKITVHFKLETAFPAISSA